MLKLKHYVSIVVVLLLLLSQSGVASSGGILKAALIFGPDENLDPAYKYTGWYMREAGIYETLFAYD
ncbi:MAG: ABC transporter substrate-binding protein, partial [Methanothrix sp.]